MNESETRPCIRTTKIMDESDRSQAIKLLQKIYVQEKGWLINSNDSFQKGELLKKGIVWFLSFVNGQPAGILRISYDPDIKDYSHYQLRRLPDQISVEAIIQQYKVADIGRFAVAKSFRKNPEVSLELMLAALAETLRRQYTHFITDVFKGEETSPYLFHKRILGFIPIATHETGELLCSKPRVTMLLDIHKSLNTFKDKKGYIYRAFLKRFNELNLKSLV